MGLERQEEPPERWRALAILGVGTLLAMARLRGRPEASLMANGRR